GALAHRERELGCARRDAARPRRPELHPRALPALRGLRALEADEHPLHPRARAAARGHPGERQRDAPRLRPERVRAEQPGLPREVHQAGPGLRAHSRARGADAGVPGDVPQGGGRERQVLPRRGREPDQRRGEGHGGRAPAVGRERAAGRSGRRGGMSPEGRRRRWPWVLLGLAVALSVVPFTRLGRGARVRGVQHGAGAGPLRAGSFVAELPIPVPVPTVGYGLVRPEVDRVAFPLSVRAVVLAAGDERVGVVTLDLLLADQDLVEAIRRSVAGLRLSTVWVAATHTHSSVGGFAWNPVAQVAGTGRFRPTIRSRVVDAAAAALTAAASS